MEEELNIYMAVENKLQDYCDSHRLGYMLHLDAWPMSMIVWHAAPAGQCAGQLGMAEDVQPARSQCTWRLEADEIILAPENGFHLSKKGDGQADWLSQEAGAGVAAGVFPQG